MREEKNMRPKVIDIYPPSLSSGEKGKEAKTVLAGSRFQKKYILFIMLIVLVSLSYFFYANYRTEIIIYLETEDFTAEEEVLARAIGSLGKGEIRGSMFGVSVVEEGIFPIEGRKNIEEKAEGIIEVCQDYTDSSPTFVKDTRFVSDTGKLFRAVERFTLLPRSKDECAKVKVVAGEPGEEYNIGPDSKFALPGLEGTSAYPKVQGVSFDLTKEGFRKEIPYLSEQEKEMAEKAMQEEILTQGKEKLIKQYGNDYLLKDYVIEIIERSMREVDSETESLKLEIKGEVHVFAIEKAKVTEFIKDLLEDEYTWDREKEEIRWELLRVNFTQREAELALFFQAPVYRAINKETLKRELSGKSFEEAEEWIAGEAGVTEIEMYNRPLGLSTVASNPNRVEIILEFSP